MKPYLYLRGLKVAEHTVFAVQDGQKDVLRPYSQQVGCIFERAAGETFSIRFLSRIYRPNACADYV